MAETTGAIPDEARRRGALILRTLPLMLVPIAVSVLAELLLRPLLGETSPPPGFPGRPAPPSFWAFWSIPILGLALLAVAVLVMVRLGRVAAGAALLVGVWTLTTTLTVAQSGVGAFWPSLFVM